MVRHFLYLIVVMFFVTSGMVYTAMSDIDETPVAIELPEFLLAGTDLSCQLAGEFILASVVKYGKPVIVINWPELPDQPIGLEKAMKLSLGY